MMSRFVLGFAALFLGLGAAAALPALSSAPQIVGQPVNTRIDIDGGPWAGGEWVAYVVDESNRDLNGDGDMDDSVLHVLHFTRLQPFPLGLAIAPVRAYDMEEPPVRIAGDYAAVLVSEADHGGRDLNGNGSADGEVLHVVNLANRQTQNLRFAVDDYEINERWLLFTVPEAEQGRDLNGDGDQDDVILYVYELANGRVRNLGIDASGGIALSGDRALAGVSEQAQGKDLNGDEDQFDIVAHLVDLTSGQITNLEVDCMDGFALTPQLAAIAVGEGHQGDQDLNGDGDTLDVVLHVYDLARREMINTRLDTSGGLAAGGRFAAAVASEANQGGQDLSGDGQTDGFIAHVYDLQARRLINTRLDAFEGVAVAGEAVVVATSKANRANRDPNAGQDPVAPVVQIYFPANQQAWDSTLTFGTDELAVVGDRVLFGVWEDEQRQDLNGDEDQDDLVPVVLRARPGAAERQVIPFAADDMLAAGPLGIAFAVIEEDHHNRDLTGNGETDGFVLHLMRWSDR